MSADLEVLALKESDVTKMLVASTHLGSKNINYQMRQYIHSRNSSGFHVINLKKMYEKLLLAARAIVAVENPADVFVISANPLAQRAVLKFARHTGATPIAGRYTPGCFTNQIQSTFREPRLLVVADPTNDSLPILEASYVNIPVIAFANASSPCSYVDIIIPCNNSGVLSMGLSWWMLAREVLRMRGTIPRKGEWEEMPDLFFHRDQEAIKREEQAKRDQAAQEAEEAAAQAAAVVAVDDDFSMGGMAAAAGAAGADDWNKDWSGGGADEDWATADSQRWT